VANEKARDALLTAKPIVAMVNDLEAATRIALEMLGAAQQR
jgi:hypothetical protein